MLLPGGHTRRKTVGELRGDKAAKGPITAPNPLPDSGIALRDVRRAAGGDLNVQQILAGEFGLVGNEGESRLGLGAHQALDRIGGALAVVG